MGQPTSPAPFRYPFRYPPSPGTCDLVGKPTARTFADLQELGGRGGIRTHEGLAPLTVFKTVAFVRSATLPATNLCVAPTQSKGGPALPGLHPSGYGPRVSGLRLDRRPQDQEPLDSGPTTDETSQ